jgi:hypothetical protein
MRNTSFRRRSGLKVLGPVGGVPRSIAASRDITVEGDDEDTAVCGVCKARLPRLTNGRPAAHAYGGVRPNTRKGLYKCEGSGRE